MKSLWIVVSALVLLSVAAFAAPAPAPTPSPAPAAAPLSDVALAKILGEPQGAASCAKPKAARTGLAALTVKSNCNATANCQGGGTVSCSGSGTCTAVDGDCSNNLEAGHVTCNGVTTTCTPACCSTGTMHDKQCCRCDATGSCMDCCRCDGGTIGQCALQCG
jgi:hypothetical protein